MNIYKLRQTPNIVTVDTRGLRCPLPVLRLLKLMREHQNAHNFQVLATDPTAEEEIRSLCDANGWAFSAGPGDTAGIMLLQVVRHTATGGQSGQG